MGENKVAVLKVSGISKTFPGVKALDDIHMEVFAGEILGVIGENGAGKSTLMKIITGAYQRDSGSGKIEIDGQPVEIHNPSQGRALGISMIYQELSIIPQLTVTENLFLGNPLKDSKGFIDWKAMKKRASEALSEMGMKVNPDTVMRDLNIADCQMIEICRATMINRAKVLIMDEPTSSLVDKEVENMFKIMRKLKAQGVAIIYISHKLDELFEISDRIEVFKDGKNSASFITKEVGQADVVKAMVGRELKDYYPPHNGQRKEKILEVRNLCQGKRVHNVSFSAYRGEILGFAGLIGAGRSETMMSIFGAMPDVTGQIFINGKEVHLKNPEEAIKAGIAYAPEDRKHQGLIQIFSVNQNTSLANLEGIYNRHKLLDLKKERQVAEKYREALNIKTPDIDKRVGELSGGNQQKVIVGKWLFTDADIVIFDEPTKGIDVGAKAEIYKMMRQIANEGKAVLMVSSELPEVIGVSDRILVMSEGYLRGEFQYNDVSEERIMDAAVGVSGGNKS